MRRIAGAFVIGTALLLGTAEGTARGQVAGGPVLPYRIQAYYSAPGYYGTSYGVASYGLRQTYTTFSSSFGPGYAYGYAPSTYLPGPWGTSLWNARPAEPVRLAEPVLRDLRHPRRAGQRAAAADRRLRPRLRPGRPPGALRLVRPVVR